MRTTSFNGNSRRVRILINITMVCVRAAQIKKGLEHEFKWKHDLFETSLKHFFKHDFRFKNLISRSYIVSLLLLFHSENTTPKNCLTCNFSLQYQYILQPTVLENKETYQLDGVNLDATLYSLKIFPEIFVTFAKET